MNLWTGIDGLKAVAINLYTNGKIGFWWVWIAKQFCSYILSIQIPDGKTFANSYNRPPPCFHWQGKNTSRLHKFMCVKIAYICLCALCPLCVIFSLLFLLPNCSTMFSLIKLSILGPFPPLLSGLTYYLHHFLPSYQSVFTFQLFPLHFIPVLNISLCQMKLNELIKAAIGHQSWHGK